MFHLARRVDGFITGGQILVSVSLRQLVRGLVEGGFGDDVTIHYECRHCGAALESADESCETCESTDVSRYELG